MVGVRGLGRDGFKGAFFIRRILCPGRAVGGVRKED